MIKTTHLIVWAITLTAYFVDATTLQAYTPVSEQPLVDLTSYTGNASVMHDAYRMFWRIDWDAVVPSIEITLDVKTEGWLGFGLADPASGGMRGSDIVTLSVQQYNTTHTLTSLTDRYALHHALPAEDSCNQYTLLGGWRSEQDGELRTFVTFSRPLDTMDLQDRQFRSGPMNVVMAFGKQENVAYHGGNRHAYSVTFWEEEEEEDEVEEAHETVGVVEEDVVATEQVKKDERIFDFEYRSPPTPIVAKETRYMCTSFEFNPPHPTNASALAAGHIVEIRPIIDPATAPYVHHYLVFACNPDTEIYKQMFLNPSECVTNGVSVSRICPSIIYGWAVGVGPLVFPEVAGLPFGDPTDQFDARYLLIQVHYDNQMPDKTPEGLIDTSGVMIRYTYEKRQYDSALLQIGDPLVHGQAMPLGKEGGRQTFEFVCPGECTSQWPWDISVFASTLHMHSYGRQIWSSITTASTIGPGNLTVSETTDVDRMDFYEFAFQHVSSIDMVIKRGDRLNVHCIYDTSRNLFPHTRPNDTKVDFSIGSEDEMCINYLFYYPRFPNQPDHSTCGLGYSSEGHREGRSEGTVCGTFGEHRFKWYRELPNPVLPNDTRYADPISKHPIWFGTPPDQCSDTIGAEEERAPVRVLVVQKLKERLVGWWQAVWALSGVVD